MNVENNIVNCTGCQSCVLICPEGCISMKADIEGHKYPVIDHTRCINCSLCIRRCPMSANDYLKSFEKTNITAIKAVSIQPQKANSASGGIFYTLARRILKDGGVVFGAAFNQDLHVHHVYVEEVDKLECLQGSKYVQSDIGTCYANVQFYLKKGRKVLFSGTPCQIAGLYAYLGKDCEELITIDLICHGVPSGVLWDQYVRQRQEKEKIDSIRFRVKGPKDKASFKMLITYKNGTKQCLHAEEDVYFKGFLSNETFRNSCYQCPFATDIRYGDITIGDCATSVKYESDDFKPYEAVSTVLLNSSKGHTLWNLCIDNFEYAPLDFEEERNFNHQLSHPTKRPISRDYVLKEGVLFDLLEGKSVELKYRLGWHKKLEHIISDFLSIKTRYHIKYFLKNISKSKGNNEGIK